MRPGLAILNAYPAAERERRRLQLRVAGRGADRSARGDLPRRLAGVVGVARLRPLLPQLEQRRHGHRPVRLVRCSAANLPRHRRSRDIRPVYNVSCQRDRRDQPDALLRSDVRDGPQLDLHPRQRDGTWTRSNLGRVARCRCSTRPPWQQRLCRRSSSSAAASARQPNFGSNNVALRQLQHDLRLPRQPDEGLGTAHVEVRHLHPEEPEGPERLHATTTASSTSTTTPATRSTRATRPPTPPSASSTPTTRPTVYPNGEYRYWNIEWYAAGQLEGQRPADARLRPALLLGAAAARRGRADVELHAGAIFNQSQAVRCIVPPCKGDARGAGPGHRPDAAGRATSAASCRAAAA